MIFDYRQRIIPNKKLPYQGQKPCRKKSGILNTLPNGVRLARKKIPDKIIKSHAEHF